MKHEALYPGDEPSPCQTCGDNDAFFRCLDCFSCGPSCQRCVVFQHAHGILHRLQVSLSLPPVCLRLTFLFLRGGTGRFSTIRLSLSSAHHTNSAMTSATPALSHLPLLHSRCSTSLASIPYESCIAYAITMGCQPPPTVANFFVPDGFQRLASALAPSSRFVSSTSSTSFRLKAKLTSTTSILLLLL